MIIFAYYEERRLPRTLECIGVLLKASPFRPGIIVVDDASTDGSLHTPFRVSP